ncbi:MAG: DnaJ domain-containing protein [Anaerolineales bacterium]|jgi:curved DNA-binding protein|nr:DnaJ domain-containing protein [Anaerolineales bacterium]
MNYQDYYQTLGVSKNASQDEIRDAFRKLARQYHPDANQGDKTLEEKFKQINEAYQVLSDPDKRSKYDQFGSAWQNYTRGGGRPEDFNWGQWASRGGGSTRTVNMEDLGDLFGGGGIGGFSDFFETLFGRSAGGAPGGVPSRMRTGRDTEQEVEITLEEAFHGAARVFERPDGSRMEIKIPKGVRTGSKVRVAGQGNKTTYGGMPGDLYLRIKVAPHPLFKREKDDLLVSVGVDLYTAILGGEVEVPTLKQTVQLKIPALTQNGKTFRLRGKGMPVSPKAETFGDLFATLEVRLPKQLTEQERQLFEQLRHLQNK